MLRISGGASGGKRKKADIAFAFASHALDSAEVKAALSHPPFVMKDFMMCLHDDQFDELLLYIKEQKNYDRILLKISQDLVVYKTVEELRV